MATTARSVTRPTAIRPPTSMRAPVAIATYREPGASIKSARPVTPPINPPPRPAANVATPETRPAWPPGPPPRTRLARAAIPPTNQPRPRRVPRAISGKPASFRLLATSANRATPSTSLPFPAGTSAAIATRPKDRASLRRRVPLTPSARTATVSRTPSPPARVARATPNCQARTPTAVIVAVPTVTVSIARPCHPARPVSSAIRSRSTISRGPAAARSATCSSRRVRGRAGWSP